MIIYAPECPDCHYEMVYIAVDMTGQGGPPANTFLCSNRSCGMTLKTTNNIIQEVLPNFGPHCEFVETWGAKCNKSQVRVAHGIPCCESHAARRDEYFR